MMFDTAAYFGQPSPYASQFTPHGLPGVFPGQYSQLSAQVIAACLAAQQLAVQQQLAAQLGLASPTPFGVQGVFGSPLGGSPLAAYGQSIGAWPALQQSVLGPQTFFGSLAGHFGQQPFSPALGGIHGLTGVPSWQSIGAWPVAAQAAGQLAGGVGRSFQPFQPFQPVPQMAYAG
jgi:hypothetical protein